MKSYAPGIVLIALILAIDLYTFKGLMLLTSRMKRRWMKLAIHSVYWMASAFSVGATIWLTSNILEVQTTREYRTFFILAGIVMLLVAPKLIFITFHLAEDLMFVIRKWFHLPGNAGDEKNGNEITRGRFLTQIGLGLAALPFIGMIYGMLKGRFDFRIIRTSITSSRIPHSFDGLRIVQISDAHLGSFFRNFEAVKSGFEMINDLKPDLIFFTGDMVNNYADETAGWEAYFRNLKAPLGKYAILGNHDYGDYVPWESPQAKAANLAALVETIEKEMGFKMLLNENTTIESGSGKINLIGVENWGAGSFSRYGNLAAAMAGVDGGFSILLSHDPSHWDAQVTGRTHIDLTLSGHTHGMQFGIEIPGFQWSPAQYRYPRWGGLYREKEQYLYVNRGFGYIGFPGRVGIPPEITLIELHSV